MSTVSKNFLNLKLASSLLHSKNENSSDDIKLEGTLPQFKEEETRGKPQRPQKRRKKSSFNLLRIPQLLMLGYASEESKRRCASIEGPGLRS